MTTNDDARSAPTLDEAVDVLVRILNDQIESHRGLRCLIAQKREAIRTADIDAITMLCQEENTRGQRLGDLEKDRLALVGILTRRFAPDAAAPLTLREIARHVPPERREPLLLLADSLLAEIHAVRRESSVVRAAAESLSRHLSGIMQSVSRALDRVGVYERRGRLAGGGQTSNCVDLTT